MTVTVLKRFKLNDADRTFGMSVAPEEWGDLPERTRELLTRGKYVTIDALTAPTPKTQANGLTCWCGKSFTKKVALSGHQRGHTARGEGPQEH